MIGFLARRPLLSVCLIVLVSFVTGAWLGAEPLSPRMWWVILTDPGTPFARIILDWRIPRVLAAFCVGACLALAGAVFQGVFRNPLAEPYLLGSASGAAVGAAISLLVPLGMPQLITLPVLSFLGAWGATLVVVVMARAAGVLDSHGLLLAGVAVAAVLSSVRSLLMLLLSDETVNLQVVLSWTLGGIMTPFWSELALLVLLSGLGLVLCLGLARGLDVLGLGDEVAQSMGLNLSAFIHRAVLTAAAVTAIAVCWGGLVGFVGLVIPHIVRWWIGPGHERLLVLSAVGGGCLLMVFDGLSRALAPPSEIPLGLLTALVGAPFFLLILVREARR